MYESRMYENMLVRKEILWCLQKLSVDMVFSARKLQEKCREQRQPIYLAFINFTKDFDLVSCDGLFALLRKIGCSPKLLSLIVSFHGHERDCSI